MAHGNLTVSTFELFGMIPGRRGRSPLPRGAALARFPYLPTLRRVRGDHLPDG